MRTSIKLKGLERSETGRNDWIVRFVLETNTNINEISVPVPGSTPWTEIVGVARAMLHQTLQSGAEHAKTLLEP